MGEGLNGRRFMSKVPSEEELGERLQRVLNTSPLSAQVTQPDPFPSGVSHHEAAGTPDQPGDEVPTQDQTTDENKRVDRQPSPRFREVSDPEAAGSSDQSCGVPDAATKDQITDENKRIDRQPSSSFHELSDHEAASNSNQQDGDVPDNTAQQQCLRLPRMEKPPSCNGFRDKLERCIAAGGDNNYGGDNKQRGYLAIMMRHMDVRI